MPFSGGLRTRAVLDEAGLNVANSFGPETPAGLAFVTDPDEGDTALFARVESYLSTRSASERLNALYREWSLDAKPCPLRNHCARSPFSASSRSRIVSSRTVAGSSLGGQP